MLNTFPVSKLSRFMVFYARLLAMMAIISILGRNAAINVGDEENRLLGEISLSINVYILLIPYITFVPYEVLIIKLLKTNEEKD
mmetsp:Transcript_24360/g.21519  ORF Transcript_24360/g.21519 Transcript_24360/m.21519 type:complete len:84 (+) Transcript_24360:4560-4811(+)